jgi:hypothetical protein
MMPKAVISNRTIRSLGSMSVTPRDVPRHWRARINPPLFWINEASTDFVLANWTAPTSKLPLVVPSVIGCRSVRQLPRDRFVASGESQKHCLRFGRGSRERHPA